MLTNLQQQALNYIANETSMAQQQFHAGEPQDVVIDRIQTAAAYAWALYTDLTRTGHQIMFSQQMLTNRQCEPTNPEFFRHMHALQDFVGQVNGLVQRSRSEDDDV